MCLKSSNIRFTRSLKVSVVLLVFLSFAVDYHINFLFGNLMGISIAFWAQPCMQNNFIIMFHFLELIDYMVIDSALGAVLLLKLFLFRKTRGGNTHCQIKRNFQNDTPLK
jgi:hypothetical protein